MIKKLSTEFNIRNLCQITGVSPSGYYQWLRTPSSAREEANAILLTQIKAEFQESRETYGSPRITRALQRKNIVCNEKRVARLMQENSISPKPKRAFRPRTTLIDPERLPAPNRLKEEPPTVLPDQVWVGDITYIWTVTGWIYMAAVMDLCSRKIVGWSINRKMETPLVKEALQQALDNRRPLHGLLYHSDRGSQYSSSDYKSLLTNYKITASMSAKGNCYDNAAMESFWSTLKGELIQRINFYGLEDARLAIFEYVEVFYNRKRLHSALGYRSPVEFEQQLN